MEILTILLLYSVLSHRIDNLGSSKWPKSVFGLCKRLHVIQSETLQTRSPSMLEKISEPVEPQQGVKRLVFSKEYFSKTFEWGFEVEDATPFREMASPRIDETPLYLVKQVHGCGLLSVDELDEQKTRPEADAIYSNRPGVSLGVFVADCSALLLMAENSRSEPIVAALHAGWRGTSERIIQKTMEYLDVRSGTVWVSPSICQKHYEVGPEVVEALGSGVENFVKQNENSRYQLDLKGFQLSILKDYPLEVMSSPWCTWEEPDLISYRQSQGSLSGRHLAWVRMLS